MGNEEGEAVRFIDREAFAALLAELEARRYELIGPTVRDGAIVLDRIEGAGDLPRGVAEIQEAGTYRLEDRGDDRLFGFARADRNAGLHDCSHARESLAEPGTTERHDCE